MLSVSDYSVWNFATAKESTSVGKAGGYIKIDSSRAERKCKVIVKLLNDQSKDRSDEQCVRFCTEAESSGFVALFRQGS